MSELPEKLMDCRRHWPDPGSELIIAEGDSAAEALAAVRNEEWQAVMPVQGKPMNVLTASAPRIARNEQFANLRAAIGGFGAPASEHGAGEPTAFRFNRRRYDRLILAFDPDVDGVHSRALLLFWLDHACARLLEAGAVYAARPPLWEITSEQLDQPRHAWTDDQVGRLRRELDDAGVRSRDEQRFRGLASMPAATLRATCTDERQRQLARLTRDHVEAARRAYEQARSTLRSVGERGDG